MKTQAMYIIESPSSTLSITNPYAGVRLESVVCVQVLTDPWPVSGAHGL